VSETAKHVVGFISEASTSEVSPLAASRLRPFRHNDRVLPSELPGVSNEQWTDFVLMMKVGSLNTISSSNGLGMFDIRYKRLADMGLVTNLRYRQDVITRRSVQEADWVAPLTRDKFLKSAGVQLKVFSESCKDYFNWLKCEQVKLPEGATFSGALAILHRGGKSALAKWDQQQFESTLELYRRVNGVF
jgi:hypothetical protein